MRRADRYTSEDIQQALFGSQKPKPKTNKQLREGVRQYVRERYAGAPAREAGKAKAP